MKKYFQFIAIAGLLASCSESHEKFTGQIIEIPNVSQRQSLTRSEQEAIASLDEFSSKLFNESAKNYDNVFENRDDNMTVSPLSMSLAIAMAANTGDDKLTKSILDALNYTKLTTLNSACQKLLVNLSNSRFDYTLKFANGVWYNNTYPYEILPSYIKTMNDNYYADVCGLDLSKRSSEDIINSWCYEKTHGAINNIFKRSSQSLVVLINSLFYESKWFEVFDPSETTTEKFNGTTKTSDVKMMHQRQIRTYSYGLIDGASVMKLLLKGNQIMYFVLPDEDVDCKELSKTIGLNDIINFRPVFANVNLSLPKYKISSSFDLQSALSGLKLPLSVEEFTKMGIMEKAALKYVQKSEITIDENGVIVASTSMVDGMVSAPAPNPGEPIEVDFVLDRPFLYMIHDQYTNTILIAGRVCNI